MKTPLVRQATKKQLIWEKYILSIYTIRINPDCLKVKITQGKSFTIKSSGIEFHCVTQHFG